MKHFLNFSLVLLIISLTYGCNSMTYKLSDDEKIVNQITQETAKKLKEKKNLVLIGTGGQMMHKIEMLAMSFNYYQEVDLNSARDLIVYAINEYLSDINNNQDVRPYLHEYPFAAKNVEIRIFIYGPDRRILPPEKIGYVSSIDGVLEYYTRADDDHPICKETYDEALSKIASSHGLETGVRNTKEEVIVNEAVAKDGAKARVIAISLEHSIYELAGEGFKPNESLNFVSSSCGEVLYFQVKANEDGKLIMGSMPAVIGKAGGICRIDILREGSPIHIKYPWESEALKN